MPASTAPHLRENRTEDVPHTEDLHVEHPAGFLVGHLLHCTEEAVARVVDDHVDAAETVGRRRDRVRHGSLVDEVDGEREKPRLLGRSQRCSQLLHRASGRRDVVAPLEELSGELETETSGGTGDEPGGGRVLGV